MLHRIGAEPRILARWTPEMVPIPGGKWTVSIAAVIGLGTTISAIVFAGFPAGDDPNKVLAVVKVIGLTLAMLLSGVAIYMVGRRKALALAAHPAAAEIDDLRVESDLAK